MPNLAGGLCHVRASYIQAVKNDPVTDGYLAKSPEGVSTVTCQRQVSGFSTCKARSCLQNKMPRESGVSFIPIPSLILYALLSTIYTINHPCFQMFPCFHLFSQFGKDRERPMAFGAQTFDDLMPQPSWGWTQSSYWQTSARLGCRWVQGVDNRTSNRNQ